MSKIADKPQQLCTRSNNRRFLGRHAVTALKECTSRIVDNKGYELFLLCGAFVSKYGMCHHDSVCLFAYFSICLFITLLLCQMPEYQTLSVK